jgi:hypothetical protein
MKAEGERMKYGHSVAVSVFVVAGEKVYGEIKLIKR